MTEQPQEPPTAPEPEPAREEPVEPAAQPVAGGTDDGEPAQGEGAPDSW